MLYNCYVKILKLRKEVGIEMKKKETRNHLEIAIIHQPVLVTVSSNILCSQMCVQIL